MHCSMHLVPLQHASRNVPTQYRRLHGDYTPGGPIFKAAAKTAVTVSKMAVREELIYRLLWHPLRRKRNRALKITVKMVWCFYATYGCPSLCGRKVDERKNVKHWSSFPSQAQCLTIKGITISSSGSTNSSATAVAGKLKLTMLYYMPSPPLRTRGVASRKHWDENTPRHGTKGNKCTFGMPQHQQAKSQTKKKRSTSFAAQERQHTPTQ